MVTSGVTTLECWDLLRLTDLKLHRHLGFLLAGGAHKQDYCRQALKENIYYGSGYKFLWSSLLSLPTGSARLFKPSFTKPCCKLVRCPCVKGLGVLESFRSYDIPENLSNDSRAIGAWLKAPHHYAYCPWVVKPKMAKIRARPKLHSWNHLALFLPLLVSLRVAMFGTLTSWSQQVAKNGNFRAYSLPLLDLPRIPINCSKACLLLLRGFEYIEVYGRTFRNVHYITS